MPEYTERVSEVMYPLLHLHPVSTNGLARSEWVSMQDYHRGWLLINVGVITDATVDVKLMQATTTAGLGGKDITGKAITQLVNTDDNVLCCIELQTEEMDVSNLFDCVAVEYQINGSSALISWEFFGVIPRYAATPTTNWQEIVG